MTEIRIRPATREDGPAIARLFLVSSSGLVEYIWGRYVAPGENVADTGARLYAEDEGAFTYRNCLVAEKPDGRVVGMVHSFPMDASPEGIAETDIVLRPYAELLDPGSLYVSGIALAEEARGRGLGRELMEAANARARAMGRPRLSLICFEQNVRAMRFYERLGFSERARRELVPHPTLHYREGEAVLLVREVW